MNIENKRQFVIILSAIVLGLTAAFLVSRHVANEIKSQAKSLAREYGKQNAGFAKEIEILRKEIKRQRGEIKKIDKKQSQYKPGAARATSAKPKPVVQMDAFAVRTPPGKRAVTILIDSLSAVGGLINAGDFVDIIGALVIPDNSDDKKKKEIAVTTVLFQNIQVLAVGTNFKPLGVSPAYEAQQKARSLNVTIAVSPQEAGLIAFAQANGKLQLSLRPPTDEGLQLLNIASWDTLSEYVMDAQGTELKIPRNKVNIFETDDGEDEEVNPYIQIFKSGEESNF